MGRPRKKPDQHKLPKTTLRLPKHVGDFLHAAAEQEDRTITAIVIRALRLYAQQNGLAWPPAGEKGD